MLALYRKEILTFFSSLTGYLVVVIFLIITGLFLWVIPGEMNILFSGYSSLEPLFFMAPWIYLFLIPAVTMKSFAEEKKTGTIELLLTRPVTELQIVLAKYLANLTVVVISLIPTFFYYYSVNHLGNPIGNIDHGATWGSYIGLLFLAAVYVSIGVFSSSITDNQVVALLISVLLCFMFYNGFETTASIPAFKGLGNGLEFLGISEHYKSISRGVIDTRDVIYFLSVITLFIYLTRAVLTFGKTMNNDEYASRTKRFLNSLIDGVICSAFSFLILLLIVEYKDLEWQNLSNSLIVVPVVVNVLYYLIAEGVFKTTIGKSIAGTKLVRIDGEEIRLEDVLLRTLCRLIPFEALSFLSKNPVGLHDLLSKTRVLNKN